MTAKSLRRTAVVALAALAPTGAQARVVFTGYADLRYNTGLAQKIQGSPATLTALGSQPGQLTTRGFSADAIGLFATTELRENLQFLTDITFRRIGSTVGQLSLQYAYLHWTPLANTSLNGGKITIPYGYHNENRFYAFERTTILSPIFQGGILGLPIADWGVSATQQFPMTPFTAELTAYMVNGYGAVPGTNTSLRSATLPGGLAMSNNIGSADNNDKSSFGGRARLKDIGGLPIETGVSYYWGAWDSSALAPMHLLGAHVHGKLGGLDLLVEGLHLGARGDQGFVASIGDTNWTTTGGFATLSYAGPQVRNVAVTPYMQGEYYRTRPNNGLADRETVRSLTGGLSARLSGQVLIKAEWVHLIYELSDNVRSGFVRLDADGALLSLVLTF